MYFYSIWRASAFCRHRRSVRFISYLPNKKCPCSPTGNKDRKYISAVPPCLPVSRPLCNGANTPFTLNAGITSADTGGRTLFPLPSAAHLLLRFSLRSQLPELSVDALRSFTSASLVCLLLPYLTTQLSVCQELFSATGGNGCHHSGCVVR